MSNKTPNWAIKPKHRKEVIATDKGWVVKDTGEILLRVNGLIDRLKEYNGEKVEAQKQPDPVQKEKKPETKPEPEAKPENEEKTEEPKVEEKVETEEKPAPAKKPATKKAPAKRTSTRKTTTKK